MALRKIVLFFEFPSFFLVCYWFCGSSLTTSTMSLLPRTPNPKRPGFYRVKFKSHFATSRVRSPASPSLLSPGCFLLFAFHPDHQKHLITICLEFLATSENGSSSWMFSLCSPGTISNIKGEKEWKIALEKSEWVFGLFCQFSLPLPQWEKSCQHKKVALCEKEVFFSCLVLFFS